MKIVSLVKKALILSVFFIFLSLLPVPTLNIPGNIAIAEASEYKGDNLEDVKLIVKSILLVKENSCTLRVYNTTDSMSVSFKSDDTDIASVLEGDKNTATITGLKVGTTTINVTVKQGRKSTTLSCDVTVGPPIQSFQFNYSNGKLILSVGKIRTLSSTILPSNTAESPIYESRNENIATVSSNGRVTAIAPGTTTITARTANGDVATCTVVVEPASKSDSNE
jgi:uncharacterized protein YjdB